MFALKSKLLVEAICLSFQNVHSSGQQDILYHHPYSNALCMLWQAILEVRTQNFTHVKARLTCRRFAMAAAVGSLMMRSTFMPEMVPASGRASVAKFLHAP